MGFLENTSHSYKSTCVPFFYWSVLNTEVTYAVNSSVENNISIQSLVFKKFLQYISSNVIPDIHGLNPIREIICGTALRFQWH